MVQPFIKAFMTEQNAEWLKKSKHTELPFEIFSDRNPLMKQVAQLAEQVREQRQPAAPDNPLLKWQAMVSDGIIAALDGYRDQRDSRPGKDLPGDLQLARAAGDGRNGVDRRGAAAAPGDGPGARRPHQGPHRRAEGGRRQGGAREAAIRALLYVGMAGAGADERSFNTLREMRAENDGLTLEAFKQTVREQYFSLVLDPEGALAAIPNMLPADASQAHAHPGGHPPHRRCRGRGGRANGLHVWRSSKSSSAPARRPSRPRRLPAKRARRAKS